MRYYVIGLALQKGLPVAVLPLMAAVFGREVVAEYALFYSATQIYANATSLGIPLAVVPIWFKRRDPLAFVGLCSALVVGLAVMTGTVVALIAFAWGSQIAAGMFALEATTWLIAFAILYSLNQIALGMTRAEGRQLSFLWASLLGGVVLLAGLALSSMVQARDLRLLLLVQVATLAVTTAILFGPRVFKTVHAIKRDWIAEARMITRFSLPMAGNALLLLCAMGADKWVANIFFPREIFTSYVIDYQSAFAMMFVPTAIALYIGPKNSALVAAGDYEGVLREEHKAKRMTLIGSVVIAIAMYAYAALTGLHLTLGYWMLAAGFVFEGYYVVVSNRLMAEMRSKRLFLSTVVGVSVYLMLLVAAGMLESARLLYLSCPIYLALMYAIIRSSPKHGATKGGPPIAGNMPPGL